MTTAQRIRALLEQHGDSVRAAARKVGIPKSTMALIASGSEANLDKWVPMIASAYGVDPDTLMGGLNPAADFEWLMRAATVRERFEYALMPIQDRLRVAYEYLQRHQPRRFANLPVAAASGLTERDFAKVVAQWDVVPPDLTTARSLVTGISRLSDLKPDWFEEGFLPLEPGITLVEKYISRAALPAMRSGDKGCPSVVQKVRGIVTRRCSRPE